MEERAEAKLSGSFWALNISQFLGVLNDSAFRWVLALALVKQADDSNYPIYVAGIVFAIPYILFSSAAGVLADRFSKRTMLVSMNFAEVIVMVFGLFAFLSNSAIFLYVVLFLMGTQSAIFSPNKLGILPEIVPREKISFANGLMEMFVYVAIILGTVGGTSLLYKELCGQGVEQAALAQNVVADGASFAQSLVDESFRSTRGCWPASVVFIILAIVGFLISLLVRKTEPISSGKRPSIWFWKDIARNLRACRHDQYLLLTLFAIGFFLFLGAFVQQNVTPYGKYILGMNLADAPNLFLVLAFGIGAGSYLAGKMSGVSVEIGFVPLGAAIVSFSAMSFMLFPIFNLYYAIFLLFMLGLGGGLYIVPLNSFLQQRAPEEDRGELIATANFISFCGVAFSSVLLLFLDNVLGLNPAACFYFIGLLMLSLTIYVVKVLPDFSLRFISLVLTRILCRLKVVGRRHIPLEGGALLVGNHLSYLDAALIMATHPRRIRFLMARDYYESRWFNWMYRVMKTIPVAMEDPPKQILKSLKLARKELDAGFLVCIFAEGEMSRTGTTGEFKRGVERIVKGSSHPIIPVNLHGAWDPTFSYAQGLPLKRFPRLGRRVTVSFGPPMSPKTNAFDVRTAVMELHAEAVELDKERALTLPLEFARVARSAWGQFCMADTLGKRLTYGKTLTASLALARAIKPELRGQKNVGILLPTTVGGALANLATQFLGKVAVNLNYTASRKSVDSAIRQADIKSVLTSRKFLEKIGFTDLPGAIYIEDISTGITGGQKAAALAKARLLPLRWLVATEPGSAKLGPDDTAAILFSSGSTAEPKGIVLSHYNIYANVQAAQPLVRIDANDTMCAILPFFHCFGHMATLYLPLLSGAGVAYHPNPLDGAVIGKLAEEYGCTALLSTPTFLLLYIRKVKPEQFKTLRIVVAGAEKLKPRMAAAFERRFGIEPLEGYGTTELSPVASLNLPNVDLGGVAQIGNQPGSIGRPLPGVVMKIVDPENMDSERPCGEEGLLLVKGPNVMQGYLNNPEATAEVMRDGWYVTGDIARIDQTGFVSITDRLSRFSKIGGEMIPHLAVEEAIQKCLGKIEPVCAVTALPDEKKGEKLIALLTPEAGDPEELHRLLAQSDLPNLWKPVAKNYIQIEALPLLGTGKIDLKGLKTLALGEELI